MKLVFERLNPDEHVLEAMSCGYDDAGRSLEDWLCNYAIEHDRSGLARVFVACPEGQTQVLGYFSLTLHEVIASDLPRKQRRGVIGASDRGLPVVLLGKFALDESLQGQGVGQLMMIEVFRHCLEISEHGGGKGIVLDVRHDALMRYYRRYGFERLGQSNRMFIPMEKAAAMLESVLD